VHDVTACLAGLDISIVDLSTRVGEHGESEPVYMMALEVTAGGRADVMRRQLADVSTRLQVDVEVHPMESEIL